MIERRSMLTNEIESFQPAAKRTKTSADSSSSAVPSKTGPNGERLYEVRSMIWSF